MTEPTRIRVRCDDCGGLVVSSCVLTLRVCVDDRHWSYCFRCPGCGRGTARPAEEPSVAALVAIGVPIQSWHLPAELSEPRPAGPILAPDDLLDLHLFLQRADWFADVDPSRA